MEKNGKTNNILSWAWKILTFLTAYVIMGVWIMAQVSASNQIITEQLREIRIDIRHLSDRMDKQIDRLTH